MMYIHLQMLVEPRRILVAHAIAFCVRAYDPNDDPRKLGSSHPFSLIFRLPPVIWTLAVLPNASVHVLHAYIARYHATYARTLPYGHHTRLPPMKTTTRGSQFHNGSSNGSKGAGHTYRHAMRLLFRCHRTNVTLTAKCAYLATHVTQDETRFQLMLDMRWNRESALYETALGCLLTTVYYYATYARTLLYGQLQRCARAGALLPRTKTSCNRPSQQPQGCFRVDHVVEHAL